MLSCTLQTVEFGDLRELTSKRFVDVKLKVW